MTGQERTSAVSGEAPGSMRRAGAAAAFALLLGLAACSPGNDDQESSVTSGATASTSSHAANGPPANSAASEVPSKATPALRPVAADKVLTLEGLGALRIGEPVPKGSGFAVRGAQLDNGCETLTSPAYPSVYAMVEQGAVRRITVARGSAVELIEGIGAGASEAAVRKAFPGFRATPHKYSDPPAKYLTQPGNEPRLRFEIGSDGRVDAIHVGMEPQLGYVEGCA